MRLLATSIILALLSSSAMAQGKPTGEPERLENGIADFHQYEGEIVRIVDGDTLTVKIHLLPGLQYTVDVRAKGVDAPELTRPKCDWEKTIAKEAAEAIEKRFPVGSWVYIENIEEGSFSGRIVADIKQWYGNQRWRTVTMALLEKEGRWGVPYKRGQDFDWCQTLPSE
jgi:endonuclease YncB( thermonuclease family)